MVFLRIFHSAFASCGSRCSCGCFLPLLPCSLLPSKRFSSRLFAPASQLRYNELMSGLQHENVQINRKVLSELAMQEPYSFKALVDQVKFMRGL